MQQAHMQPQNEPQAETKKKMSDGPDAARADGLH